MNLDTLHAFEGEVSKAIPQFKLAYKDQSTLMKVLGFLSTPFNPQFMTHYTTTLGNTVYFPSKDFYESSPQSSFTVLSHELVHMMDEKANGLSYQLSYIFPQLFAPIVLLVYLALARTHSWPIAILILGFLLGCWLAQKSQVALWIALGVSFAVSSALLVFMTGWLSAIYFAGLALFAPWPAPWRTKWEGRGYVMNLAVLVWTMGPPTSVLFDMTVKYFTGPSYYFMSWSSSAVQDTLKAGLTGAQSGVLQKEQPYGLVFDFLAAHGELRV